MKIKEVRINVRTTEQIKRDLEVTAELRGLTVSSLVNALAVNAIREEKSLVPGAFQDSGQKERKKTTDWREALKRVEGMWKDRDDLPDFQELRREWDRSDRWNRE